MAAGFSRGRLLWRCRRGMKELDVVLERYVRASASDPRTGAAEVPDWASLERLLALPDPQVAAYLLGGEVPAEPELARLVGRIRACNPGPATAPPYR